jgi:hypothetical protein
MLCPCWMVCDVSSCASFLSRPCGLGGWKDELFLQLVVSDMSLSRMGHPLCK